MRQITISVSANSDMTQTKIHGSFSKLYNKTNAVGFIPSNKDPLPKIYNQQLDKYKDHFDHIFFIHDDVILRQHLSEIDFNGFTVVGLAGANNIKIKSPFLWHLMGDRQGHLGAVAHATANNYYITSFGQFNRRAVLIDGVFIGIDLNKWKENPVYFDENIPTPFHFYDLCFSLDCSLKKIPVGVVDFPITHASPGLNKGFEEWQKGERYCLDKYKKFAGKTLSA
ncbi:hypothetical protein EBU95_19470 [bacterium]|nr:hypothetical protein [bacterium]